MLRKIVCSAAIVAFAVGFGFAEEIRAVITKVDGNNVTFAEYKGKGEKGPEKTLPAAGAKVNKGKQNAEKKLDAGDPIEGGLTNAQFKNIAADGLRATVFTDAGNTKITEIRVGGGKKKN